MAIDSTIIDAGDGDHSETVLDFCNTAEMKTRHIWAGKGYWGATRDRFKISKDVRRRWVIVGVDALKGELFNKLQNETGFHFSYSLEEEFYRQLASEHRVTHLKGGIPVSRFERISKSVRAEALDMVVYATAALVDVQRNLNVAQRVAKLRMPDGHVQEPPPNTTRPQQSTGTTAAEQLEALLHEHPELRDDPELKKLLDEAADE